MVWRSIVYKMKAIILLFVCGALAFSSFEEWSRFYQKTYVTEQERMLRSQIWQNNMAYINEQNAQNLGYVLAMNQYGDLTWNEFSSRLGFVSSGQHSPLFKFRPTKELPQYVNWTKRGMVTRVKNQYSCGSCWAFSAVGAVESMNAIETGKLISLSEENLIDCTFSYHNLGCAGGSPVNALEYILANHGIATENSYPLMSYSPYDCLIPEMCPCLFNVSMVGATIVGYYFVPFGDEITLQYVLAFVGPVSVAIVATPPLQFYRSGIFSDPACSSQKLNHAILAVGFGFDHAGNQYYILKNSWGEDWGDYGYFLLARNKHNMCGIASEAVFPY